MIKVLITGAGSYVGESVRKYILSTPSDFEIDAVDTMGDNWKKADYSQYDVVYHDVQTSYHLLKSFSFG